MRKFVGCQLKSLNKFITRSNSNRQKFKNSSGKVCADEDSRIGINVLEPKLFFRLNFSSVGCGLFLRVKFFREKFVGATTETFEIIPNSERVLKLFAASLELLFG